MIHVVSNNWEVKWIHTPPQTRRCMPLYYTLCRHIKEHMGEYYQNENMTDELKLDSEEEMEFHYFKLHDYDGNNKLDGLELGAAMTHFHEGEGAARAHNIALDDDEMASLIDQILAEDDLNNDGYIDYYEFTHAQRKGSDGEKDAL